MAENYKVEVDIDIDGVDDAEEKFLALGKSIDKAKQELDEMRDSNKQGSKAFKQQKKELEDMEQSFKELNKELKGVDASFEDVYGEVKPLTAALGEAEDRLYQLALAGDKTSQEYQDLLQKVSAYRRVQMDTDMAVDAFAGTLSEKLGGALQGAASGFAAVQGVMALTGSESEDLEETLIKLNAAMAIAQGISGLREGAKAFTALGKRAKTALSGVRVGIAATGIGAFVVVLGTVAAYWDDISKAVGGTKDELEGLKETTDSVNNEFVDLNVSIAKMEDSFEMAKDGTLSHEEALKQYNEEFGDTIGYANSLEEAEEKFILRTDLYVKMVKARALADAFYKKNAELLVEAQEELGTQQMNLLDKFGTSIANITRMSDISVEQAEENRRWLASRNKELEAEKFEELAENQQREFISLKNQLDKIVGVENKKNKTTKDNRKKVVKELMDITNDLIDVEFANLEKLYGKTLDNALIRLDHKYTRELEKYDELLEDQRISEEQHSEMVEALKEKNLQDIQLLREQFTLKSLKTLEVETNMEQTKADKTVDIYTLMYGSLNTMRKKDAKDQIEIDKQVMAARLEIAHAGLGAIGDLVNSLAADNEKSQRRAFNINKAVGIAQAIISTAQGVTKALAETTDITPTQSLRFANAAVVAISGAAQVATIARQKFQTSGGAGGSNQIATPSGGGSGSAPSFNVVGDSGISQLAGLQMQPTQAYVVSGDITTAQSLDRNKIENATI